MSSVHINFLHEDEALDISRKPGLAGKRKYLNSVDTWNTSSGYLPRTSLQYHWHNRNPKNKGSPYRSFDEFLHSFKSKRRISIRRERESVKIDQSIRLDNVTGFDIRKYPGLTKRMFEIYVSTIRKMAEWRRQYLTLEFFERLVESDFCEYLCFFCARSSSKGEILVAEDVFAGTISK